MADYEGPAEARYSVLQSEREPFLRRARECATYTIPSLIPPEGSTSYTDFEVPYTSLGARGVNHLAGKLLLGLLPSNTSFFLLTADPKAVESANPPLNDNEVKELDETLAEVERRVLRNIASRGLRVHTHEAFKHLIVAGNVLMHIPSKGARVFPLHQYVTNRDPEGNVLEIIVKECVSPLSLPVKIQEEVKARMKTAGGSEESDAGSPGRHVDIYTYVQRKPKNWTVYQEVKGMKIPGTTGQYPLDKLPWLPLRWSRIDGESYGRGHCEEYLGDLRSLEGLSQAIVEGAAAAAKCNPMVKPGSTTNPDEVARAQNLQVITGDAEDVTFLRVEKNADFTVAANTANEIKSELSYAFLLNSAVQRDGERVTAEEIRYVAQELETALGGVYSIFAEEFQRPLVVVLLQQGQRDKTLPDLPDKAVDPIIVTGVDALNRSQQFQRIFSVLTTVSSVVGPDAVAERVNLGALLQKAWDSEGVESKGLVRSDEEVAQSRQQAQVAALAEKAAPNAVKAAGDQMLAMQQGQSGQTNKQETK